MGVFSWGYISYRCKYLRYIVEKMRIFQTNDLIFCITTGKNMSTASVSFYEKNLIKFV